MTTVWVLSVLQVIWIDILLSGDNAVVIALACQSLEKRQRKIGITLGVALAIIARLTLAAVVSSLMAVPSLKLVGGLILLYISVKVIHGDEDLKRSSTAGRGMWRAVGLVAIADVTMSLDNVVAISAAARGDVGVFIIGLIISMPFTVVGATVISGLVTRFPVVIWGGGALLGWISGGMIFSDPLMTNFFPDIGYIANSSGATVVVVGCLLRRWLTCVLRVRKDKLLHASPSNR